MTSTWRGQWLSSIGIGKLPLPCRNTPGFLVNRILAPYLTEALFAHHDGYALETIDRAAEDFGMPMGPVELADRVGLDVVLHAAESLGTDSGEAALRLRSKVEAGELGAKSGAGFYRFRDNRPIKSKRAALPDRDLQDRLILPLLNAAVACSCGRSGGPSGFGGCRHKFSERDSHRSGAARFTTRVCEASKRLSGEWSRLPLHSAPDSLPIPIGRPWNQLGRRKTRPDETVRVDQSVWVGSSPPEIPPSSSSKWALQGS